MNPTLSDLAGGISTVTLSDEEARRRGTRKTVLERKAPPTFDILVEIADRNRFAIYKNVADVVDAFLRGYAPQPEIRERVAGGGLTVVQEASAAPIAPAPKRLPVDPEFALGVLNSDAAAETDEREAPIRIFPYGVSRNKIERAIANLCVNAAIARQWDDADVVLTLKTLERKESEKLRSISAENIPLYSIKTNTTTQIQNALKDFFNLPSLDMEEIAMREAGEAIYRVLLENKPIELTPQTSYVRRMQHQLAEQYRLQSRSTGLEPNRRVLIFRGADFPFTSEATA
jgi:hypothetical protein